MNPQSSSQPTEGYFCASCGEWHDELPLDVAMEWPSYVLSIPEVDRAHRVTRDGDFVSIDDEYFFVRAGLELPIKDNDKTFVYGVWGSLSRENFERARSIYFDAEASTKEPDYFSWFSNQLPDWPETLGLRARLKLQADSRPTLELEPSDHPLAIAQREGIEMKRVVEIVSQVLHSQ